MNSSHLFGSKLKISIRIEIFFIFISLNHCQFPIDYANQISSQIFLALFPYTRRLLKADLRKNGNVVTGTSITLKRLSDLLGTKGQIYFFRLLDFDYYSPIHLYLKKYAGTLI